MSTKDFSNVQEKSVAKYLGWKVVTGSGAAACHPGDIESDEFLGECKTHTKPGHRLVFDHKVWNKLCEEAVFKHRWPVLVTDDGSQSIDKTWCMILPLCVDASKLETAINLGADAAVLRLDEEELAHSYRVFSSVHKIKVFSYRWGSCKVYLLPLTKFKEMIEG